MAILSSISQKDRHYISIIFLSLNLLSLRLVSVSFGGSNLFLDTRSSFIEAILNNLISLSFKTWLFLDSMEKSFEIMKKFS
jgi:hypothetical protein